MKSRRNRNGKKTGGRGVTAGGRGGRRGRGGEGGREWGEWIGEATRARRSYER